MRDADATAVSLRGSDAHLLRPRARRSPSTAQRMLRGVTTADELAWSWWVLVSTVPMVASPARGFAVVGRSSRVILRGTAHQKYSTAQTSSSTRPSDSAVRVPTWRPTCRATPSFSRSTSLRRRRRLRRSAGLAVRGERHRGPRGVQPSSLHGTGRRSLRRVVLRWSQHRRRRSRRLVDDSDLSTLVSFGVSDHKWKRARAALVGSTLMPGAADLVLRGALAGGASMIRFESRGEVASSVALPPEVVHSAVRDRLARSHRGGGTGSRTRSERPGCAIVWATLPCPVVLDADGLDRSLIDDLSPRDGAWVLTPHEGEFNCVFRRARL